MIEVLIGAAITWVVSYVYYIRASRDLRTTTKEIKQVLELIAVLVKDNNGQFEIMRDNDGNLTGLKGNLKTNISGSSNASASIQSSEK